MPCHRQSNRRHTYMHADMQRSCIAKNVPKRKPTQQRSTISQSDVSLIICLPIKHPHTNLQSTAELSNADRLQNPSPKLFDSKICRGAIPRDRTLRIKVLPWLLSAPELSVLTEGLFRTLKNGPHPPQKSASDAPPCCCPPCAACHACCCVSYVRLSCLRAG